MLFYKLFTKNYLRIAKAGTNLQCLCSTKQNNYGILVQKAANASSG